MVTRGGYFESLELLSSGCSSSRSVIPPGPASSWQGDAAATPLISADDEFPEIFVGLGVMRAWNIGQTADTVGEDLSQAAALILAADTRQGVAYQGYGVADNGNAGSFLRLGKRFSPEVLAGGAGARLRLHWRPFFKLPATARAIF